MKPEHLWHLDKFLSDDEKRLFEKRLIRRVWTALSWANKRIKSQEEHLSFFNAYLELLRATDSFPAEQLEKGEQCEHFCACLLDDFRAHRREILALLMAIAPWGDNPDHLECPSAAELDVDAIAALLDTHKLRNKIADEGWGREMRAANAELHREQGYLVNPDSGWPLLDQHGSALRSVDGQHAAAGEVRALPPEATEPPERREDDPRESEARFVSPYVELQLRVTALLGPALAGMTKKEVRHHIEQLWDAQALGEPSTHLLEMMATMVRHPEAKKGGWAKPQP